MFKKQLDKNLTDSNILLITASSIFLPYILTGIVIISLAIYVVSNSRTRKCFLHKITKAMVLFFIVAMLIPLLYRNWIGLIVGVAVCLAICLGLFLKSIMTSELYERVLTLICFLSLTSVIYAIGEKLILPYILNKNIGRASAVFLHPNYFGTVMAMVIIICAYKLFTNQGLKKYFVFIAGMNAVGIYLSGSMFAWVHAFVGVAVLLVILKKTRLLVLWTSTAVILGFMIFVLDLNIIPRLSDAELTTKLRMEIWGYAFEQIRNAPLFGHGFMSIFFVHENYLKPHAHSIYIDMIVNLGFVGSVIFIEIFLKFFTSILNVCFREKRTLITSLIIAITTAALVHGFTDITLFWLQTLPLYLIILSGFGVYEKTESVTVYKKCLFIIEEE